MAKNGANILTGLTIFKVSTIAFAFLFGFGFQGGQDAYGKARTMIPGNFMGNYAKAYNTRTVFRR